MAPPSRDVGYRFDYLVAPLRCAHCNRTAQPDEMLEMTTRLRDTPNLAYLGVGDKLPVTTQRALDNGYELLRAPQDGEPTILLQPWACASCGATDNWAEVVIEQDVIEAIDEVVLDADTLARANFRAGPR
ncbi:hypothetical protein [Actinocrispum sp. NPDC049592]|uniref:hypothetical protein n=1 Tax=Actinocrispum sp. NPDC049592 TaxID=3154835 RepID=UPI00342BB6C6